MAQHKRASALPPPLQINIRMMRRRDAETQRSQSRSRHTHTHTRTCVGNARSHELLAARTRTWRAVFLLTRAVGLQLSFHFSQSWRARKRRLLRAVVTISFSPHARTHARVYARRSGISFSPFKRAQVFQYETAVCVRVRRERLRLRIISMAPHARDSRPRPYSIRPTTLPVGACVLTVVVVGCFH